MKVNENDISMPELENARKLTPLELNAMRWDNKHTVLTPELLREMNKRKGAASSK